MASSLQAQLGQLAEQRKLTSVAENSNQRPSVLFTWRKAADLDKQAILQIGQQGFDDLIVQQPRVFAPFEEPLFSDRNKDIDRNLLTADDNAALQTVLDRFLRAVSPVFTLQASLKTLEWLVRGYRINEMNIDTFILAILPFHETREFVQTLRTISIPESSPWNFLIPVRVSGLHMERPILVQQLAKNPHLFTALARAIDTSISEGIYNVPLASLFMVTAIEFLQSASTVDDQLVRPLMNCVFVWLGGMADSSSASDGSSTSMPAGPDMLAASQMIFAVISRRMKLQSDVLDTYLLQSISPFIVVYGTTPKPDTTTNISQKTRQLLQNSYRNVELSQLFMFLALVARTQSIETIPEKVLRVLADSIPRKTIYQALEDICLDFDCATLFGELGQPFIINDDEVDNESLTSNKVDESLQVQDVAAELLEQSLEKINEFKIDLSKVSWYELSRMSTTDVGSEKNVAFYAAVVKHFKMLADYSVPQSLSSATQTTSVEDILTALSLIPSANERSVNLFVSKVLYASRSNVFATDGSMSEETSINQFAMMMYLSPDASMAKARLLALAIVYDKLKSSKSPRDFQLLVVPMLIVCSTANDFASRVAGLAIIREIELRMKDLVDNQVDASVASDKKKKVSDESDDRFSIETCGLDGIFGNRTTTDVRFLPHGAAFKLIYQIISRENDVLRKPESTPSVIRSVITTMSKKSENDKNSKNKAGGVGIRHDFLLFLVSHITVLPNSTSKAGLVRLLEDIEAGEKNKLLIPVLSETMSMLETMSLNKNMKRHVVELCSALIETFIKYSESLFTSTKTGSKLLNTAMNLVEITSSDTDIITEELAKQAIAWTAQAFTRESDIDATQREKVFVMFFDLISSTDTRPDSVTLIKQLLSENVVPEAIVKDQLSVKKLSTPNEQQDADSMDVVDENVKDDSDAIENERRKRKKAKTSPAAKINGHAVSDFKTMALKRLVCMLELLTNKRVIPNGRPIISSLFSALEYLITADLFDTIVPLEYLKQLCITSISNVLDVADDISSSGGDIGEVRVELLIQTFRSTEIPQTQTSILLLLSKIAKKAPLLVLYNIIPIFTFMGARVLRQDDNYNFHVIQQTLETLLPIILTDESTVAECVSVLNVFCDALPHIPKHRRLKFFGSIISILGVRRSLTLVVRLLLTKSGTKSFRVASFRAQNQSQQKHNAASVSGDLEVMEFLLTLARNFSFEEQLFSAKAICHHVLTGKYEKQPTSSSDPVSPEAADFLLFTGPGFGIKDFSRLKLFAAEYVMHTFSSKVLRSPADLSNLEDDVLDITNQIILAIVSPHIEGDAGYKYVKAFRKLLTETLSKIHSRCSPKMYVRSIVFLVKGQLLEGNSNELTEKDRMLVRNKGLEILYRQVGTPKFAEKFSALDAEESAMISTVYATIIPVLTEVVLSVSQKSLDKESFAVTVESAQNALMILASFARGLAPQNSETADKLLKTLDPIANALTISAEQLLSNGQGQNANISGLYVAATVCISTYFSTMGVKVRDIMFPVMDSTLPLVISEKMKIQKAIVSGNIIKVGLPLLSSLQMLKSIIEVNPLFMAFYIRELISVVVVPFGNEVNHAVGIAVAQKNGLNSLNVALGELAVCMTKTLPPQELMDGIYRTWKWLPLSYLPQSERSASWPKLERKIRELMQTDLEENMDEEYMDGISKRLENRMSAYTTSLKFISECESIIDDTRVALLELMGNAMATFSKDGLLNNHQSIFQFFLRVIDYRRAVFMASINEKSSDSERESATTALAGMEKVESSAIQMFVRHTMKLNDSFFKPKFFGLSDWAKRPFTTVTGGFEQGKSIVSAEIYARSLTFFKLQCALLSSLKSLYVPYFSFTIPTIIQLAKAFVNSTSAVTNVDTNGTETVFEAAIHTIYCEPTERPSFTRTIATDGLWRCVMQAISLWMTLEIDSPTGAFTELMFDNLVQPVVDQVESISIAAKAEAAHVGKRKQRDAQVVAAAEKAAETLTQYFVPVAGQLALARGKEQAWRAVNTRLLQATRSDVALVRLVALQALRYLYERMGDDVLVVFPETIPFLAELLEDTEEMVETECRAVCDVIQRHVEGPIADYFTA